MVLSVVFLILSGNVLAKNPVAIFTSSDFKESSLNSSIKIWEDTLGRDPEDYNQILKLTHNRFTTLDNWKTVGNKSQLVGFNITNPDKKVKTGYLTVGFTDKVTLYCTKNDSLLTKYHSGDFINLPDRPVYFGQLVALKFPIPANCSSGYYLRVESASGISMQFKSLALHSLKIYSEAEFLDRFEKSKTYQALFYGALFIMLFYNMFLMVTLRSASYLFYVLFLALLILFLASNNGYLAEIVLYNRVRSDLYIRFLSAPLLVLAYLYFSKTFLALKKNAPVALGLVNILSVLLFISILAMGFGYWYIGRFLSISLAILAFLLIFGISIYVIVKGYQAARYFLIANIFLIAGGIFFAVSRYFQLVDNPLSQYSIQLASLFQVTLFSMGLADQITFTRRQLANQILENERITLQKEQEKNKIILEKNAELEIRVVERTAEVEKKNKTLSERNQELHDAELVIKNQNRLLENQNTILDGLVKERTKALAETNDKLTRTNAELAAFIYRLSHDIRGPIARLLGLSSLAIAENKDPELAEYLDRLNITSEILDTIIRRLNYIYQLNELEPVMEDVDVENIINNIIGELSGEISIKAGLSLNAEIAIKSDQRLMRFVIFNLIENAMKFSTPDEKNMVEIAINSYVSDGFLYIIISDHGCGISATQAPFIFDMFSRANKNDTPGLGLYMARKTAEKLGGTIILLDSKPGFTRFELRLPC